jgi:2-succinyl-5-enolpyruvyl-6-hydroxy-3-cyclohexene-1-carboxylate synthase
LGRVLVDELARHGMRHAVVAPGSRSAPLALALAEHPAIELRVTLDERSASFLALGIAKATRLPTAVLCTSGTAAANFHPAVLEAHHSRTPLIVFTADRPPELRDTGASQTIDQLKLYGDSVRWFAEVGVPEELASSNGYWRSLASRAWAAAQGSPPGPVHLNVAFRDPLVPDMTDVPYAFGLEGRPDGRPWTELRRGSPGLDERQVEELATELSRASAGAIVAGAGPFDAAPIHRLARRLGWPLLADPFSGARTPGSISTYDALLRSEAFGKLVAPDVVIRVGAGLLSKSLAKFVEQSPRQILIDRDAAFLDPRRSTDLIVAAEPAGLCDALSAAAGEGDPASDLHESWIEAERKARTIIDGLLGDRAEPSEPRTARDVAAAVPDGGSLVVASSMPLRDVESFMAPRDGLRLVANRGANGIDGFVSTALGVALSEGGPTVALSGDLSILHDQNGFLTSHGRPHGPIDASFVVINNDGGGIFSFLPQARLPEHFEELFGTPQGIDFSLLARLHGCGYTAVEKADELPGAVAGSIDRGGTNLIEVRTERAPNVDLHEEIWAAVADAFR